MDESNESKVDENTMLFLILMSKLPVSIQEKALQMIEKLAFPFYQAATGKYPQSDNTMRRVISEKLERDFKQTEWVARFPLDQEDEDLDEEEEEAMLDPTLNRMQVLRVFSQSNMEGYHDIKVIVGMVDPPHTSQEFDLSEFLITFEPVDGPSMHPFDA